MKPLITKAWGTGREPRGISARRAPRAPRLQSGFTMIEIAISLAVIGIALVAIIGVLPIGMNTQKDNREETIINQDATVFIQAIRSGANSQYGADLMNYVYAISNSWTLYKANGNLNSSNVISYTSSPGYLTNNARIIGLLSTPEYTDNLTGFPIPNLINGGYSNHVVAYVHSISGPAVEKPPQDNPILQQDSFSYKIICDNVPVAVNMPFWQNTQSYNAGDEVLYNGVVWRAIVANAGNQPDTSSRWTRNSYAGQLTANLHEVRLTFLWPLLPSGKTGGGRQTFRTMVGGQITTNIDNGVTLYYLQSQSFTNAP